MYTQTTLARRALIEKEAFFECLFLNWFIFLYICFFKLRAYCLFPFFSISFFLSIYLTSLNVCKCLVVVAYQSPVHLPNSFARHKQTTRRRRTFSLCQTPEVTPRLLLFLLLLLFATLRFSINATQTTSVVKNYKLCHNNNNNNKPTNIQTQT